MTKEEAKDLFFIEYRRYCNMKLPYDTVKDFYTQYMTEKLMGIESVTTEFYNAIDNFVEDNYYDTDDFDLVYNTLNIQSTSDMIEFLYKNKEEFI